MVRRDEGVLLLSEEGTGPVIGIFFECRLIRMFSFAGDTVLDPFAGTGTTVIAALNSGRNSISVEIEPKYVAIARERLREANWLLPRAGAFRSRFVFA